MKRKRVCEKNGGHLLDKLMREQKDVAQALLTRWLRIDDLIKLTRANDRVVAFLRERRIFYHIFGDKYDEICSIDDVAKLFIFAVKSNLTFVTELLLNDPRVDPSDDNNYAIEDASFTGHTEVVKLLLADPRVNPAAADNYAIRWASQNGHADVVALLLADPRLDPAALNYAIRGASQEGHADVVKLLLNDPRVDPAVANNYAIRFASENGHAAVVKLLLADPRVTQQQNYKV